MKRERIVAAVFPHPRRFRHQPADQELFLREAHADERLPAGHDPQRLRHRLRMYGKTSHDPNAATRFRKSSWPLSHSSTVTFWLGTLSLLSILGSADPVRISL